MGLFDTVWITCPLCNARVEMQIKPPQIEGEMQEWELAETPESVVRQLCDWGWDEECDCGFYLSIRNDPYELGSLQLVAAKYFPIASPQTQPKAR